jgi:hypothetical protein
LLMNSEYLIRNGAFTRMAMRIQSSPRNKRTGSEVSPSSTVIELRSAPVKWYSMARTAGAP